MTQATTFLMFQGGKAEAALNFYAETVPDSRIVSLQRFGPEGPGPEGTVLRANAVIAGLPVMAHDSFVTHAFDFTPSISFFVECDDEAQIDALAAKLLDGGTAMMPLGSYGFSRKFAWIADTFGVSWQLNLQ